MFGNLTDRAKAAVFYAIAFILGIAILSLAPVFGIF